MALDGKYNFRFSNPQKERDDEHIYIEDSIASIDSDPMDDLMTYLYTNLEVKRSDNKNMERDEIHKIREDFYQELISDLGLDLISERQCLSIYSNKTLYFWTFFDGYMYKLYVEMHSKVQLFAYMFSRLLHLGEDRPISSLNQLSELSVPQHNIRIEKVIDIKDHNLYLLSHANNGIIFFGGDYWDLETVSSQDWQKVKGVLLEIFKNREVRIEKIIVQGCEEYIKEEFSENIEKYNTEIITPEEFYLGYFLKFSEDCESGIFAGWLDYIATIGDPFIFEYEEDEKEVD